MEARNKRKANQGASNQSQARQPQPKLSANAQSKCAMKKKLPACGIYKFVISNSPLKQQCS